MNTDVLIVGAGPTGLMLAGWLARAGVSARVIDKKDGPTRESRALGVQARTMEVYDQLDLGKRALSRGIKATGINIWLRRRTVARLDFGRIGHELSPHQYIFILGQDKNEALLYDHLREHGGDVEWRTELTALEQDATGVTATLRRSDGKPETVGARYVCGCDGAHSAVRRLLGIEFLGGTNVGRFFVADVTATGAVAERELSLCLDDERYQFVFPMPGKNHYRIIGVVPPRLLEREDLTFEDVRSETERRFGMRVAQTHWFATYRVHHRVAQDFRRERAFLLGDAGHIHSPLGGQGMNTGLMDATNLAWKLAAVLRGQANDGILDTYGPERQPFARSLVNTTDRAFGIIFKSGPLAQVLRTRIVPILITLASRVPALRRRIFLVMSQTRVQYHDSPLSRGMAGRVRAGDRLPWAPLASGSNYDALRDLRPQLHVYGPVPPEARAWAERRPDFPLRHFPFAQEAVRAGFQESAAYLVRPDGYVGYAAARLDPTDLDAHLDDAWDWRA